MQFNLLKNISDDLLNTLRSKIKLSEIFFVLCHKIT